MRLLISLFNFSSCRYVPSYFQGEYLSEIDAKKVLFPDGCERSALSHVDLIARKRASKTLIFFSLKVIDVSWKMFSIFRGFLLARVVNTVFRAEKLARLAISRYLIVISDPHLLTLKSVSLDPDGFRFDAAE